MFIWKRSQRPEEKIYLQAVFGAVRGRLIFDCGLFEDKFTDLFLLDRFYLQVCQCYHDTSFDRFCRSFSQELITSPFFLFKKYLEVVDRVFFNKVQEDIFPCLANIFLQTKIAAANNRDLSVIFILGLLFSVKT